MHLPAWLVSYGSTCLTPSCLREDSGADRGPRRCGERDCTYRYTVTTRTSDFCIKMTFNVVVVDRFYIAPFSAFEQTHCARMWFYMSKQLFIALFFFYPPKWFTYSKLMFHWLWERSHKTVHKPQLLKREEIRSGTEPRSFCLTVPPHQTASLLWVFLPRQRLLLFFNRFAYISI